MRRFVTWKDEKGKDYDLTLQESLIPQAETLNQMTRNKYKTGDIKLSLELLIEDLEHIKNNIKEVE